MIILDADDPVLKTTNKKYYEALAHQSALLEISDWLKITLTILASKFEDTIRLLVGLVLNEVQVLESVSSPRQNI